VVHDDRGFKYVLVGYKPEDTEAIPQNSTLLFQGALSRNFEELTKVGYLQSAGVFRLPIGEDWFSSSRVGAQMAVQTDVTDPHAREHLTRYYKAIEEEDYETISECVTEDVIYRMHTPGSDPDTAFAENVGESRDHLLRSIERWRRDFGPFRYDMVWSIIGTSNAMARFRLVCGDKSLESQCAYSFQVTYRPGRDPVYKISSITHIVPVDVHVAIPSASG